MFCIWFTNHVLDDKFFPLGLNWMMGADIGTSRNQVLGQIFPLESNCKVYFQGYGGSNDIKHWKCLLPPNVILQYIILVLWFWYAMLLIINVLNLALILSMLLNSAKVRSIYLLRAVGNRKVNLKLKSTIIIILFLLQNCNR